MEQTLKKISINIKAQREKRGWSQENLAEEAGLSTPFINQVENGKRNIAMRSFLRILEAFNISSDVLIPQECKVDNKKKQILEFGDIIENLDDSEIEYVLGLVRYNVDSIKILLHRKKVGHMNKAAGNKAAYRGMGSIDFFAVARSVLLVGRVEGQANTRAVVQIKNNLAAFGHPKAFELSRTVFIGWEITI